MRSARREAGSCFSENSSRAYRAQRSKNDGGRFLACESLSAFHWAVSTRFVTNLSTALRLTASFSPAIAAGASCAIWDTNLPLASRNCSRLSDTPRTSAAGRA